MRTFVAGLLVCATAQDVFLAPETKDADVIIVGAGWSGMSAAHHLVQAGVNVKVLEARSYTGGRTHAIQFGDPSVGVFTQEIGSGWLESSGNSGGPEHGPPPVSKMAEEYGLKVSLVPGSTQNISNYMKVYASDGSDCDPDGSIRKAATKAYGCIGNLAQRGQDPTIRQALRQCGWRPKTECELVVDWALTVDDPGMVAEEQDLKLTLPDEVYEWWGPNDRFIIDERPRGYAGTLDYMVKDTLPDGDSRLIFNTKVTNVAYDTSGVTISTEGGKTYKSDVAITTFPLGVLKKQHRELFTPNYPKKLAKIIDADNMVMSNLTRIYVQFPEVFWENDLSAWLAADGQGSPGNIPEFQNMNHESRHPGSNTLLIFLGNPESVTYETMDDADVQAAVVKKLQQHFPGKTVPEPVAFHITRWGLDPLAYGCYSGFKPGFDDDSYERINKPLTDSSGNDRVFQAGEAMCDDLSGSTYGAYQSGRQWALTYLHSIGKGKKPKDICWW